MTSLLLSFFLSFLLLLQPWRLPPSALALSLEHDACRERGAIQAHVSLSVCAGEDLSLRVRLAGPQRRDC